MTTVHLSDEHLDELDMDDLRETKRFKCNGRKSVGFFDVLEELSGDGEEVEDVLEQMDAGIVDYD